MDTFEKILKQKNYLESLGYDVLYMGLFGSQNYGLDNDRSDIDLRAIVLPTMEQLIKKERVSKQIETEIGLIDVKDIIDFHDVIIKGNFAYIESVKTKWFVGDEKIRDLFKDIRINLNSLKGDMYTKAKAFRSPYSTKEMKDGYEAKELYHLIRMYYLFQSKDITMPFIDYSNNEEVKNYLLDIKYNKNNIIDTLDFIDISSYKTITQWIEKVTKDLMPEDYDYVPANIIKNVVEYTKDKIVNKLLEERL